MDLLAPKIHDLCQLLFTLSIIGFWKTDKISLIIVCNCEQTEPAFFFWFGSFLRQYFSNGMQCAFIDRLSGAITFLYSGTLEFKGKLKPSEFFSGNDGNQNW
jgi:hypothetical protein